MSVRDLDVDLTDSREWTERHALDLVRLTEPQREWCSIEDRFAVWSGANGIGKSFAAAVDTIHAVRGTSPWRRGRGPVPVLLIGYSWAQMDPLLQKLWMLLPKDEIDPKIRYVPRQGIRGYKEPVIPFVRGPGAGRVISFATYEQGPQRIMGSQVGRVGLDEPPPEAVWGEALPRVSSAHGEVRATFTPTPDAPDLEYLRELIRQYDRTGGRRGVRLMKTSITLDGVTPRGGLIDRPRLTQQEIDDAIDSYLEDEREMRAHGEWTTLTRGRWVSSFLDAPEPAGHLSEERPPAGAFLVVSIDHGAQAGKQAAMVTAYTRRDESEARCWWVAESVAPEATTTEEDAVAIVEMLRACDLKYDDVDMWIGDRSLDSKYLVAKSNERLRRALAKILDRDYEATKPLIVPFKYPGSVRDGAKLLRGMFKRRLADLRPAGLVHPRCIAFRAALLKFAGNKQDPCKDVFDAGRYGPEAAIKGRQQIDVRYRL